MTRITARTVSASGMLMLAATLTLPLTMATDAGEQANPPKSEKPPVDHGDVAVTPIHPTMDAAPTHSESDCLRFDVQQDGLLESFAVDSEGDLLVAFSFWKTAGNVPIEYEDAGHWIASVGGAGIQGLHVATGLPDMTPKRLKLRRYEIRRLSPEGRLLGTWPQELTELHLVPKRIAPCPNGDVYIAGAGSVVRFDKDGLCKGQLEFAPVLQRFAQSLPPERRQAVGEGPHGTKISQVAGLAANETYVFFCLDYGPHRLGNLKTGIGAVLGRCRRDLTAGEIVQWDTMIGCCRDLKIVATEDEVIAANNNLFRVSRFDLDGNRISYFGNDRKRGLRYFVGCCDPMGIAVGPEDSLFVFGVHRKRIWRFSRYGTLLSTTAHLGGTGSTEAKGVTGVKYPKGCYAMIQASPTGDRIYAHDLDQNAILVFTRDHDR